MLGEGSYLLELKMLAKMDLETIGVFGEGRQTGFNLRMRFPRFTMFVQEAALRSGGPVRGS